MLACGSRGNLERQGSPLNQVERIMVDQLLTRLDRILYKMRYPLMVALIVLMGGLAETHRAEAYCNTNSCGFGAEYCSPQSTYCNHTPQEYGFWDDYCQFTNCCLSGPCYVYNDLGTGCYYCHSGNVERCGYAAGC